MGVTSGDMITILTSIELSPHKIRLAHIDCPESSQDFGTRAKQATSSCASGKVVKARVTDKDKYRRTVGEVTIPGSFLIKHLVEDELAWWYQKYSASTSYKDLQEKAKATKRGLWSRPDAMAPWNFGHGTLCGSNWSQILSGWMTLSQKQNSYYS